MCRSLFAHKLQVLHAYTYEKSGFRAELDVECLFQVCVDIPFYLVFPVYYGKTESQVVPSYANRSVRGVEWKTLVCHASDHLVRFSPTTFARSLRAIAYLEVYLVRVIAIDEGSYAALFSCRDRRNVSAKV